MADDNKDALAQMLLVEDHQDHQESEPINDVTGSDEAGHGKPHSGISWVEAAFFQAAIILGLGVLGIPWTLAQLGWIVGVVGLFVSAAGGVYSGITISMLVGVATDSTGKRPTRFVDLGEIMLGGIGRKAIIVSQYSFLGGAIVAVQLTAAHTIVQLADAAGYNLCLVLSNLIVILVMLPVMQLQTLNDVTWAAVLGVVAIIIPLIIYMTQIADDHLHSPTSTTVPSSTGFTDGVGAMSTIAFAYQGQTIFPEIIAEMKSPSEFPRSVIAAVAIMTTVYLVVGGVGYDLMGADAEYFNKWDNKNHPKAIRSTVASILLIIHVLTGYIINGNVLNHIIMDRVYGYDTKKQGPNRRQWFTVTIMTLSGSFFLSNLVPSLGLLIAVIGATSGVCLTFLFPSSAVIWGKAGSSSNRRSLHLIVFAASVVLLVAGAFSTIDNLVKGIVKSKTPFTC